MKRIVVLSVAMLSACASAPEDIQTSYISPLEYANYDCNQISMETVRVNRRAANLEASLNKKADNDATQMGLGLILFWPTLFFLEGGDGPEAQEYARLKGEREALESAAVQKRCTVNSVQKPAWGNVPPQNAANGYTPPPYSAYAPSPAYNAPQPPAYGGNGAGASGGPSGRTLEDILGNR